MKKTSILLILIILSAWQPAWADKQDLGNGFLNLPWGAAAEALSGDKNQMDSQAQDERLQIFSRQGVELGGVVVDEIQYVFFENHFAHAVILHHDVKALIAALRSEYGPPDVEHDDGIINWRVNVSSDIAELVTVGVIPERNAVMVINNKYFTRMLEGLMGK